MSNFLLSLESLLKLSQPEFIDKVVTGDFEEYFPGFSLLSGCSQGTVKHIEGDVLVHTYLVFKTLDQFRSKDVRVTFDSIDLLAALVHDIEKPSSAVVQPNGHVAFPGHEQKAAARVSEIAKKLELNSSQEDKLFYLVANHGVAHFINEMSDQQIHTWYDKKYWLNLKLLQMADALNCWFDLYGQHHLPVHYELFDKFYSKH